MRAHKALLLSIAVAFSGMSSANAASVADCVSVTSGQFKKSSYESTYEITVRNACGDSFSDSLNYTSLQFYAGSSILNAETASILYLPSYGQNFTFRLRNLKSGTYSPYLKIWSPKDYSSRTVNLPGFSIADPLNCVSVSSSEFFSSRFDPMLRITVKNNCSDLNSNAFSGFQYTLNLPGYFSYLGSQSIYSLSSYGSSLDFSLRDIKPGSYSPTLEIRDSSYQTKRVNLGTFFVSSKPTPTRTPIPVPTKSSVTGNSASFTQVCAISKEFSEQCSDYPEFNFDFCSSLKKASLQEKVGAKWVYLWTVTGTIDSSICSDSKYPYYILATGENSVGKKTSMRLVFAKTPQISSYTQIFTLVFR